MPPKGLMFGTARIFLNRNIIGAGVAAHILSQDGKVSADEGQLRWHCGCYPSTRDLTIVPNGFRQRPAEDACGFFQETIEYVKAGKANAHT
jgi:hypothetical protein